MSTLATLVLWVRGTAISFGVMPKEKVPWLKERHPPPKGAPFLWDTPAQREISLMTKEATHVGIALNILRF